MNIKQLNMSLTINNLKKKLSFFFNLDKFRLRCVVKTLQLHFVHLYYLYLYLDDSLTVPGGGTNGTFKEPLLSKRFRSKYILSLSI